MSDNNEKNNTVDSVVEKVAYDLCKHLAQWIQDVIEGYNPPMSGHWE